MIVDGINLSPGSIAKEMITYKFQNNRVFYDWYKEHFSTYHTTIADIFYKDLFQKQVFKLFPDWFKIWFPNQTQILFPHHIQVLTKTETVKLWTQSDDTTFVSHHPPPNAGYFKTKEPDSVNRALLCHVGIPA